MSMVEVDKEKLADLVTMVKTSLNLEDLAQKASDCWTIIKGNPLDDLPELYQLLDDVSDTIEELMETIDAGLAQLKAHDPDTEEGALRLEAAVKILDEVIVFGGAFGLIAERFDDDVLRLMLTFLARFANKRAPKVWADRLIVGP